VLLTVCRLTAAKGVDHTIRAIARLATGCLVVAGDGPARPALEALTHRLGLGARVRFLGYVPREGLPLCYRAADYTVLYSGYEGLSHVLLESLRAGTPVIASDRGGNAEVVRHGENGWLVPFPDADALPAALERALAAGEPARCAANSALGLERFAWERMVEDTIRVLQSVR
jgi:glycosyltransferase involved in cell wall biosynthesis